MSPTTTLPPPRKARGCWNRCAQSLAGRKRWRRRKAWRLRTHSGASAVCRPACARPAGSLPPRRHQTALPRLGRPDRLLPLFSAMPVGRFVLDVHGESRDIWPANDALCAALQVINHLQDCAKDYRELNRVYIPDRCWPGQGSASRLWTRPRPVPRCERDRRAGAQERASFWSSRGPLRPDPRRPTGAGSRSHPDPGR